MEVGGWVQVPLGFFLFWKSVLSMSVMGFQNKVWMGVGGWVGVWVGFELYPSFLWDFLNFFNFAKPLSRSDYTSANRSGRR